MSRRNSSDTGQVQREPGWRCGQLPNAVAQLGAGVGTAQDFQRLVILGVFFMG